MKRKLLSLLCALMCASGAWAQSWTGGASTEVYLKNVGSNLYWGAANTWGTQASLVNEQQYVKLISNDDGTFKMESMVSNGGTKYYFNGSYMDDGTPVPLTITSLGDGKYSIANGSTYYGWDGSSTVLATAADASSENFQWVGYTRAEIDELNATALSAATNANPVDATCLILDSKFGRNRRDASTVWSITAENKNLNGGGADGGCAESYHSTFTLSQSLSKAPNGKYKLTAQAFYRKDEGAGDNIPYIYIANGTDTPKSDFMLMSGTEDGMAAAATSFKNGLYQLDDIYVVKANGQSLSVGAKLEEETHLWSIWANFQLTYYGNAVEVYSPASFTSNTSADADKWYSFSIASAGGYKITSSAATTLYYTQDATDDADATVSKEITADGYTFVKLSAGSFYFKSSAASTIKIETVSSSVLQNGDVVTDAFITNPSFEDGTTGWTANNNTGLYTQNLTALSNKVGSWYAFIQKSGSIRTAYQTVNSLIQGKYVLSVNAMANADAGAVNLSMGSSSMAIPSGASAATYFVAYETTENDASADVKISASDGNGSLRRVFFDNFTLTYYTELPAIDGVDALLASAMAGNVRAALVTANTNYTAENGKTVDNYNALQTAIVNAKVSIADFAGRTGADADWTSVIANHSFTGTHSDGPSGTTEGWTITGTSGNRQFGSGTAESWHNNNVIFSQVIKNLPAGTYKLTAQVDNCHDDANVALYATCNGTTYSAVAPYRACSTDYATTSSDLVADESLCLTTLYIKVEEGKDLTIGVKDESTGNGWMIFDNFKLTYNPTLPASVTAVDGKMNSTVASTQTSAVSTYNSTNNIDNLVAAQAAIYAAHLSKQVYTEITTIKSNYDTKAADLDATGQATYAAGTSATQYTNGTFETTSEAETAYHNDYIAAVKAQTSNNANMTDAIVNPSFETGNTTGWTYTASTDNGAKLNSNEIYTMSNVDGSYLFNIWSTGYTISQTLTGMPAGKYRLTAVMGTDAGATLNVKLDGETGSASSVDKGTGVEVSVEKTLTTAGDLTISADAGGTMWYKVDNFRLTLLESYYANATDYAALNAAITTAEANTLGFESGDYAPYNNIDALTALAAAKAIDQTTSNTKASVQTATTNLTGATWTANNRSVECVYNGDFSHGEWGLEGWSRPGSWGKNLPSDEENLTADILRAAGASTGSAYYNQDGSLVYGTTGHYTMPLKANTIYSLTFKYASWEGGDSGDAGSNDGMTVSVLNSSNEGMAAVVYEENNKIYNTSGAFDTKTIYFVTTTAGNYVLTLANENNTVMTDVSITKAANQHLEFADGSVPSYAPGTYPSVKITRTLTAGRWATAVYPFAVSGVDNIAVFNSYNAESGEVGFSTVSESAANQPFLMRSTAGTSDITLSNVEVAAANVSDVTKSDVTLKGTYTAIDIDNTAKNYVLSNNQIYVVGTAGATINPYRAYFQLNPSSSVKSLNFSVDNESTAIEGLQSEKNETLNGDIYDLQGRRVMQPARGIYIVNGKKVLVK